MTTSVGEKPWQRRDGPSDDSPRSPVRNGGSDARRFTQISQVECNFAVRDLARGSQRRNGQGRMNGPSRLRDEPLAMSFARGASTPWGISDDIGVFQTLS